MENRTGQEHTSGESRNGRIRDSQPPRAEMGGIAGNILAQDLPEETLRLQPVTESREAPPSGSPEKKTTTDSWDKKPWGKAGDTKAELPDQTISQYKLERDSKGEIGSGGGNQTDSRTTSTMKKGFRLSPRVQGITAVVIAAAALVGILVRDEAQPQLGMSLPTATMGNAAVPETEAPETEAPPVETPPVPSQEELALRQAEEYAGSGQYANALRILWEIPGWEASQACLEAVARWQREASTYTIAAGRRHSMRLLKDQTVLTCGQSERGTCDTAHWTDVVSVATGDYFVLGLTQAGTVLAEGPSQYYTAANPGGCYQNVADWRDIVVIAAGDGHSVGMQEDGTLFAAGLNDQGQCRVEELQTGSPIVSIAAGYEHTVALHADGTVTAVGSDALGQCSVEEWTNIVAIAAGSEHTVGLRADGTVVATGQTEAGQCKVGNWTNVKAISAGDYFTVCLTQEGTVYATGKNHRGQLDVEGWKNVIAIAAGNAQTMGLCADGSIVYAGAREYALS